MVRTCAPVRPSPAWRQEWPCRRFTPVSRTSRFAVSLHELRNKPVATQNDLYKLPVRLR